MQSLVYRMMAIRPSTVDNNKKKLYMHVLWKCKKFLLVKYHTDLKFDLFKNGYF